MLTSVVLGDVDGTLILAERITQSMISPELLKIPFTLNVVFLVLLLISLPALRAGSATYYVAILSFGVVGVSLLLFGGLLWRSIHKNDVRLSD